MNENNDNLKILKPQFFSKDDPKNPKNINVGEKLKETKDKIKKDIENKKIVIDKF